jgi:hypothetical protein
LGWKLNLYPDDKNENPTRALPLPPAPYPTHYEEQNYSNVWNIYADCQYLPITPLEIRYISQCLLYIFCIILDMYASF